jgi:N-acetylglucosamine-1-phosphate uridyltransferase (contains nucleotidyltransferase and I-patch acetyltransferase domains)
MEDYKIYLSEKKPAFGSGQVMGMKYVELAMRSLETPKADAPDSDMIARIYDDTPLVTKKELDLLARLIDGGETGYKIGSGYIKKSDVSDGNLKEPPFKVLVIDSLENYDAAVKKVRWEILEKHSKNGVIFHDPASAYIEAGVAIGAGTVVYPMVYLRGKTSIGANSTLFSFTDLIDTQVGDNTDVRASFAISAKIGKKCTIGPYACLRKGAIVGDDCRVGDFVEIKNSTLENGVKAAHLAYVGDSYVGENTNVGCGVVFANFDGKVKRSVIVGKDVFIGCNTNLVAPLEVEDGAYIAAGSTVTQNVPGNALCIARARQIVKPQWNGKEDRG